MVFLNIFLLRVLFTGMHLAHPLSSSLSGTSEMKHSLFDCNCISCCFVTSINLAHSSSSYSARA
uniref:Secreted protein n=1 Tax=Parascaris equorum TaxID=6256 RepID=A0A914R2Y7_PAREQ